MKITRTLMAAVFACGLGFAAAAASAQDAPPPPPHPGMEGMPGMKPGEHMAMMKEHMEKMRAEHLQLIHDALAIRPDQEAAFQAFAASMAPHGGIGGEHMEKMRAENGMAGHGMGGEHAHMTTPERLDRMAERMQAHLAAFQQHAAAVKALYGALDERQRKTFDALGALKMHGMHGGGGMHMEIRKLSLGDGPDLMADADDEMEFASADE